VASSTHSGIQYSYEEQLPAEEKWSSYPHDLLHIDRSKHDKDKVESLMKEEANGIPTNQTEEAKESEEVPPLFVRALFDQFKDQTVTVKNVHKRFGRVHMDDESFKKQRFQVDSDESRLQDAEVKFHPDYLDSSTGTTKTSIKSKLSTKLMKVYDMAVDSMESVWPGSVEKSVCHREHHQLQDLSVRDPILLEFLNFETLFDKVNVEKNEKQIEPLFLSMFLLDTQERKRISEVFHVDMNDDRVLDSLVHAVVSDPVNKMKNAIFHINHRSTNIHLVLFISKVLEGDDDTIINRYSKPKPKSPLAKKLRSKVTTLCTRFGNFRQWVAWTHIPLFGTPSKEESHRETEFFLLKGKTTLKNFYRCRGSMSLDALINTIENSNSLKKLKTIQATLEFRATELKSYEVIKKADSKTAVTEISVEIDEDDDGSVVGGDDVGSKVKGSDSSDSDSDSDSSSDDDDERKVVARNLYEFKTRPSFDYSTDYMHNMYVRPLSVNLASKELKRKSSQNISVQVELKSTDEKMDTPGLASIYGKSSEPLLLSTAYTGVSYHDRSPEFFDEFKVKLPAVLTKRHNFVFTFLHVSCRGGLSKKQNTVIGRAVVPILGDNGTLAFGKKSLPIFVDAPKDLKSYLSKNDLKFLSNGKMLFHVEFSDASTIYTHDERLNAFFSVFSHLHLKTSGIPETITAVDASGETSEKTEEAEQPPKEGSPADETVPDTETSMSETSSSTEAAPPKFVKKKSESSLAIGPVDEKIVDALGQLSKVSEDKLYMVVDSLPTIFDHLLRIMCHKDYYPKSSLLAFDVLIMLCSKISSVMRHKNRNGLISRYIQSLFNNFTDVPQNKKVFEILPQIWTRKMYRLLQLKRASMPHKDEKAGVTKSFEFSWVIFDLIAKSLTLHISDLNQLNSETDRWSNDHFTMDTLALISTLTQQLSHTHDKHLDSKSLNSNLGLFMRDLLDIMDRGCVLTWIDFYLDSLGQYPLTHPFGILASEMRIHFMEILADYEQYVPMSLPKLFPVEAASDVDSLFSEYFLCGLVMKNIASDLTLTQKNGRTLVIGLLRNILSKHEYDERYQDAKVRSQIISMCFPLVLAFLDKFDRFISLNESKMHGLKNTTDALQSQIDKLESQVNEFRQKLDNNERQNRRLLEQDIQALEDKLRRVANNIKEVKQEHEEEKMRCRDEKQSIFVCIVYILVNMDRNLLKEWSMYSSKSRMQTFLKFLKLCLVTFEYRGKSSIATNADFSHDSSKNVSKTKSFFEKRYNDLSNSPVLSGDAKRSRTGTLRQFRARLDVNSSLRRNRTNITSMKVKGLTKWEGCLSAEITLSVLDIVCDLILLFQDSAQNGVGERKEEMLQQYKTATFPLLFDILLHTLNRHEHQARITLRALMYLLRVFVGTFPSFLFEAETAFSEELCLNLLRCCYTIHADIRSQSTALLYSVLKINYVEVGRFTQTKMNTTVALSNLVDSLNGQSVNLLQKCFEIIAMYAQKDPSPPPEPKQKRHTIHSIQQQQIRQNSGKVLLIGMTKFKEDADFASQVVELTKRLNSTLLFTVQINKEREDPTVSSEAVAETMLRIAHNYRHAPELSITWLNNLYKFHDKNGRHTEAGMITILMAATCFQYLKLKGIKKFTELSYSLLEASSPTLKEHEFSELKSLFDDPIEPEFSHTFFTEAGFIKLVYRAIGSLKNAKHYEYCIFLFKLLVQYYEPLRAFTDLQSVYAQMSEYYNSIEKCGDENRMFGTFYKIGLYGKRAKDLNGCEYIYKYPKITRLGEVTDYIEKYFFPVYGKSNVKIKSESFKIDDSVKNNADFVYIQVACVKPFFDTEDKRLDYFEKNTHIRSFIYETPFTASGKAHGSVTDQCIRKTILTAKHSFPGLLTQADVSKKTIIELSPIEYAIQTVEKSLQKLQAESSKDPPEMNSLHLVLMGTVIPTVNEGVPAIVKAFMGDEGASEKWDSQRLEELKHCLKSFLNLNAKAIIVSSQHKTKKMSGLHNQFVIGYGELYELITKYVGKEDVMSPDDISSSSFTHAGL